ncbi:MAG: AraC family transcriptional regulator [Phycisphaera sp.]|nr:AraC family transcriptional regulator [Phycisphaera sp.]
MTTATTIANGNMIMLAHGGGGQLTDELIQQSILPRLGNKVLGQLLDAGIVEPFGEDAPAITIDSYVVSPWRFPGGDIGYLSVCGTVNDLAVCGAEPMGIALGLIIAEGFARRDLEAVLDSVAAASKLAGVPVVTGDTKVVGHNQGDGVYITTAGIGRRPKGVNLSPGRVRPGDLLVVKRLLTHEHVHIKQVPKQVGFGTSAAMHLIFRRELGMSPSEYRKKFGYCITPRRSQARRTQ